MPENARTGKTHLAIQGILALLNKPAGRTQIVKLVYLADNRFYESVGRTLTGNAYIWDHYGPNDVDNSITAAADELAECGRIVRTPVVAWSGGNTFRYSVKSPVSTWQKVARRLNAGEQQILRDIAKQYGHIANAAQLAEASKQTAPFANAKQHERLQFKQSERAIEVNRWLDSIDGLQEELELGLADIDEGRWVWHEDLDAEGAD